MVPTEIFCHIFSFLSYPELYRIRSVCHEWKRQSEYSLYLKFKREQQTLKVHIGQQIVKMIPVDYDPNHQVIEFQTPPSTSPSEHNITDPHTSAKIIFSEWKSYTYDNDRIFEQLDPIEQAQALFHMNYNSYLEQRYEIPIMPPGTQTRYVGDRGVIVTLECVNAAATGMHIKSVHANLSWLLSGIYPNVVVQQIYELKYQKMICNLDKIGFKPTRPYSESIHRYLMQDDETQFQIMFSKEEEASISTIKLHQIQNILQENNVDPRVVWKYTFTKNYIYRSMYSDMNSRDVAKSIVESEKKWASQREELVCKVNKGKA